MPRTASRRKLPSEDDNGAPKPKLQRIIFELPVPKRLQVTGRVLVCGQGDMGQLGLGNDDAKFERKRPALIEALSDVVDVCAGGMHNLVLTSEGKIYSFGCNDEGALGRDTSEEDSEFEPKPVDLPGLVVKISGGDSHSACLLEDGSVYAWGSFRDSHGNMGLTLEGNKRLPINVLPSVQCCDISSGADHLVILTCAGKVYTVGCGEQGQLGRVSLRSASGESRRGKTELLRPAEVTLKRVKTVDVIWATNYCTYLRDSQTKAIWAFGLNNYKQLGYGKENGKDKHVVFSPKLTDFQDVKEIAGGQHHTLILKEDGSCSVIGRHDYGRLGLGETAVDLTKLTVVAALAGKKIVKIACGEAQSFALTAEGGLYSWGMGSNLQLGTGSEDDALEPVLIVSKQTEGKSIILASSGGQHSIFLVKNENQANNTKPTPKATKKQTEVAVDFGANNGAITEAGDNQAGDDAAKSTKTTKVSKKPTKLNEMEVDNDSKNQKTAKAVKTAKTIKKPSNGAANATDNPMEEDDSKEQKTAKTNKTTKKADKSAPSKTNSELDPMELDDAGATGAEDDVTKQSASTSTAETTSAKRGRKKK